jgi:hypothetical protein
MSSLPEPYQRQFNFTDWQANHPVDPPPGTSLDAEFNAVLLALTNTQERLARIQTDEGNLNPPLVLAAVADQLLDLIQRIEALEARP